jgi:hypothetical protein
MIFFNPLESEIFLPTAMGKIGQKYLKWVILVNIYGKTNHFRHFWEILRIAVGKKLSILMGLKKLITKMGKIHLKFYLCYDPWGIRLITVPCMIYVNCSVTQKKKLLDFIFIFLRKVEISCLKRAAESLKIQHGQFE